MLHAAGCGGGGGEGWLPAGGQGVGGGRVREFFLVVACGSCEGYRGARAFGGIKGVLWEPRPLDSGGVLGEGLENFEALAMASGRVV